MPINLCTTAQSSIVTSVSLETSQVEVQLRQRVITITARTDNAVRRNDMKILRSIFLVVVFSGVGLLAFYLTALTTGEPWSPAWESEGMKGVLLWAYERGSIATVVVLFLLALACGWLMPINGLLAAISLALFYPLFAIFRLVSNWHTGNLLPFEFLGYLLFILVCVLGYVAGRWVAKKRPMAA